MEIPVIGGGIGSDCSRQWPGPKMERFPADFRPEEPR